MVTDIFFSKYSNKCTSVYIVFRKNNFFLLKFFIVPEFVNHQFVPDQVIRYRTSRIPGSMILDSTMNPKPAWQQQTFLTAKGGRSAGASWPNVGASPSFSEEEGAFRKTGRRNGPASRRPMSSGQLYGDRRPHQIPCGGVGAATTLWPAPGTRSTRTRPSRGPPRQRPGRAHARVDRRSCVSNRA
jgi:hypothetical protein